MKPTCPERFSSRPANPVFREIPPVETFEAPRALPGEFDLPAGALWSFDPQRAAVLRCTRGDLWITQTGDPRDFVLCAGETFTPAAKGRVVVQALTDARIAIADRALRA